MEVYIEELNRFVGAENGGNREARAREAVHFRGRCNTSITIRTTSLCALRESARADYDSGMAKRQRMRR